MTAPLTRPDRRAPRATWVHIDKNYVFETPEGRRTLSNLFDGRRQLLVQRLTFTPGRDQGLPELLLHGRPQHGMNVHLAHRDATLVAVSRTYLCHRALSPTHGLAEPRF
jgi:predicted dithiol-disulfide oxidoreductase (DUF899 family)